MPPHAEAVVSMLEDSDDRVRCRALHTLSLLTPAMLARHADAVVATIEDSDTNTRVEALQTLGKLEPVSLAQYAGTVVGRLEDSSWQVRREALETLRMLEPAKLAQHADVVMAMLRDGHTYNRALFTLAKLPEPATFRHQLYPEFERLLAVGHVCEQADFKEALRCILPRCVTHAVDFDSIANLRSRLLGRLAWYRFRLRRCVKCLALYWYALPYRPSGPGHARDVAEWGQMREVSAP